MTTTKDDIFAEIEDLANYNWSSELDDFKTELVESENEGIKTGLMTTDKKKKFSRIFATSYGAGSMILSFFALNSFLIGSPIVGSALLVTFLAYVLGFNKLTTACKSVHQRLVYKSGEAQLLTFNDYELSPNDLMAFWDQRVKATLQEKRMGLNSREDEVDSNVRECEGAIQEVRAVDSKVINKSILLELENHKESLIEAKDEIRKYKAALRTLEGTFEDKIKDLQGMLKKEQELEQRHREYEDLNTRVSGIIGKSQSVVSKWKEERDDLQSEIAGIIGGFQEHLQLAGEAIRHELLDYNEAVLEVESLSPSREIVIEAEAEAGE